MLGCHLVLIRHGQSEWNKKNLFTGWTDVDLSEQGEEEALSAGLELKKRHLTFDQAFSSALKRAIRTMGNCVKADEFANHSNNKSLAVE